MLKLEITTETADELVSELTALLKGVQKSQNPVIVTTISAAPQVEIGLVKAPEPTPLEEAIAKTPLAKAFEAAADTPPAPEKPKGRGRPRKNSPEAPAGALSEGTPSVPASQPAVENTGSDSLPPSPSVGDVAVESPVAVAPAAVTVGADAATMRKALQDLMTRVNTAANSSSGNEGLDAVAEVLAPFGFAKVSQITPDKHDEIIKAAGEYPVRA